MVKLTDVFLWAFVKDKVHRTPLRDMADLRVRICAAINNVTPQMLHNTWIEVDTGLIVPVPLIEAMLRFMEHEVKNHSFHFVAIGFIYRLLLFQKL